MRPAVVSLVLLAIGGATFPFDTSTSQYMGVLCVR
jgi:hypothetical protein